MGEPHERVPNSDFLCRQLTLEIQRVLKNGDVLIDWKLPNMNALGVAVGLTSQ